MRTGIFATAVLTLGVAALPSMVNAGEARGHREEARPVVRENRTVEVRHDDHRDVHVDIAPRHDVHVDIASRHDVRVDEHVVIDRDYRHWDHDRVFIPAPAVTVAVDPVVAIPCVTGFVDTPVTVDQVPPVVLNGVAQQTGGAPIVSVDWLHNGPAMYYDVHIAGPENTVRTLRFGLRGVFYGYL